MLHEGSYLAMADGSFVTATNEEIGKVFQRSDLGPWLLSSYNFGYSIALPVVRFETFISEYLGSNMS